MEQFITDFGVCCKITHLLRMDREWNEGWVGNVREYVKGLIKEGHDIQEILLDFCHEYDDIMDSQRLVEDDYEVVVDILEKLTDKVLLVPMCFSLLALIYICWQSSVYYPPYVWDCMDLYESVYGNTNTCTIIYSLTWLYM